MITAHTGLVPEWYTLEDQIGEADATEFYCVPLTQPQMMSLQKYFDLETRVLDTQAIAEAFMLGCRQWKNVADANGDNLPWSTENMKTIPTAIIADVGAHILYISNLKGEDIKN